MSLAMATPYFRRDQSDGISPPDLAKCCTLAEHIVHARGKRTQLTSVSLDLAKIRDFGDADYRLKRELAAADGHIIIEHDVLLVRLAQIVREENKAERQRAVQAIRYARQRKEGIVDWRFDVSRVERKELIPWAHRKVQAYFDRV